MKTALFLIALCWTTAAAGQSSYRNGHLIKLNGDTVNGYIRYGQKGSVPAPCYFKIKSKDSAKAYPPQSLRGFRLNGDRYYISRSIGKSEDVFLEILVSGKTSLYKFGKIYFIEKGPNSFFELSEGLEVSVVEGEQRKKKSRNFIRMLNILTADCPEVSKKVSTIKLKDKPLIRTVSSYNTCMGSTNTFYRKRVQRMNINNSQ